MGIWPAGDPLLPHPGELLTGLLPMVLLAGVVLLAFLLTRRPQVPAQVGRAVAAAGYDPARPPDWPAGQWNAQVVPDGSLMTSNERGTLRIENGWLGFHAGGVPQPTWIVPTSAVRAGKNSSFSATEVWLESPWTGRLQLSVSHEHIDLFPGNDFKDFRERRYADELLWLLHQSGAQIVAG